MTDYQFLRWETYDDGQIVRISLNRPEQRNAQNRGMLVELDDAFTRAEADDTVRVVILAGEGPMFSSGHDIGSKQARAEFTPGPGQHPTRPSMAGRARARRRSCCRSGTTSSRTTCAGETCARSRSPRSTEMCSLQA